MQVPSGSRRTKSRPAFSLLICPDSFLCQRELSHLLSATPPSQGTWQKCVYWGDEAPGPAFFDQIRSTGLLENWQYLYVHNAEQWNAESWKKVNKALTRISPTCWPIFALQGPWQNGAPKLPSFLTHLACYQVASKRGWIWQLEGLSERTLRAYVFERAKSFSSPIPREALDELASVAPFDARAIEQELTKLALYYAGKEKLAAEDWAVPNREQEFNYFSCIQHIENGSLSAVLTDLKGQRDYDRIFFTLSVLLEREFRVLWQIKTGFTKSLSPKEASYKASLAKKTEKYVLARAMTAVAQAEQNVKQSITTATNALPPLLVSLTQLFSHPRRPPSRA